MNTESKRRGPKGYFQGSRKEFLESQLPAYLATRKTSRRGFWHVFWSNWWGRYPWRLDDSEEPPTNDPAEMEELGRDGPDDKHLKAEVEQRLTGVR